ncbi:hypothetical protein Ae201684P_007834 [Aphanomyces euteiches]|uniref:LNR domain-containing protein n=1 Tax=Aphanomyces euteiches TaxID=100861 RepID=A0A6G0XSV7_9STRA|nr:hypothetical protein Ae201684_001917 [Aphanomyces euteiches]KAH9089666.1 hypothetical protein Ae201684P_007834 [Aphanomyces euteiches]
MSSPAIRPAKAAQPRSKSSSSFLVALVLFLHFVMLVNLTVMVLSINLAKAADVSSVNLYMPKVTLPLFTAITCIYAVAFLSAVSTCSRRRSYGVAPVDSMTTSDNNFWSNDLVVAMLTILQIGCQSYQTYEMFDQLTHLPALLSYAGLVVLDCFVSPVTLLIRNREMKTTSENLADVVFCVALSGGHPTISARIPIFIYVVMDPNMSNDNAWAAEAVLTARRMLVPTSGLDLFAKLTMYGTPAVSLRRSLNSLRGIRRSDPSKNQIQSPRRRLLCLIVFGCTLWGMAFLFLVCRAVGFRDACPAYCVTHAYPLVDLSCLCIYANINCVKQGIDNPSALLHRDKVGPSLFFLQISRCPLKQGLAKETLEPFTQLGQIMLLFTDMEAWDGPLPPDVNQVSIRFSQLRSIPRALYQNVSEKLVVIELEGCRLDPMPPIFFEIWSNIAFLTLANVTLTELPRGVSDMANVQVVILRNNRLTEIPSSLVHRQVTVDLSGNSIAASTVDMMDPIQSRQVLLSGTPYCDKIGDPSICHQFCAEHCSVDWVGDHRCDWACFNSDCGYDGGDCDEFGFDRI